VEAPVGPKEFERGGRAGITPSEASPRGVGRIRLLKTGAVRWKRDASEMETG
jgi:hypothetical protein